MPTETPPQWVEMQIDSRTLAQMLVFGFAEIGDDGSFYISEKGSEWLRNWCNEKLSEYAKRVNEACDRLKNALDEHLDPEVWNHELKTDFALVRNWAEVHARKYKEEEPSEISDTTRVSP